MRTSRGVSRAATLFAAGVVVFSSVDAAAETWVKSGPGPEVYIRGVSRLQNTPAAGQATVFLSTLGQGVLKLVDNGTTVTTTAINNGLPYKRIRTVTTADGTNLFVALEGHGMYKSTDGGANWVAANGSGVTGLGCLTLRNLSRVSNTELYAVTACRRNSGVWRTLDGGATWSRLGGAVIPDDADIGSLNIQGTGVTTTFVASGRRDGIFRSNDNGATWTQINNGIPAPAGANRISVFNVSFPSTSSTTTMLAWVEGQGVYRSIDSGASWAASNTGLPANTNSMAGIVRESATVFYIGTDKGPVYRSTDAGVNWAVWGNTGSGEETSYVRGVTLDASVAPTRYWLHGARGLVKTTSTAATFTSVPLPEGYLDAINVGPNGVTGYAAAGTIFKIPSVYTPDWSAGTDIGATLPGGAAGIVIDRNNAQNLFATLGGRGVYKSITNGGTWTKLNIANFEVGTNPFVELAPSNSQIVFVGLDNKYETPGGGGVQKSIDGGGTFADSSSGLSTPESRQINSMAIHPTDPNIVYITTDAGIYRSANGGATWTLAKQSLDSLAAPLPFGSVRLDPANPAVVWAGANHVDPDGTMIASSGVWKSIDSGTTWTQMLAAKNVNLVRPEANGRVVIAFSRDNTQPAFKASIDGGTTWTAFTNGVLEGDGVGLSRNVADRLVVGLTASGTYILAKPLLTVTVTGPGSVTSNFGGITCPGTCTTNINDYDLVTLTATPSAGITFAGWGGACTGTGSCTVRMDAAKNVTALFDPQRLANISTRGLVLTGNDRMIAGFIINGTGSKTVVINVAGPFLSQFGLNGLADPQLSLVRQSDQVVLKTNDDWQTQTNPADVAAITASGYQPNNTKEPAIIATLPPGAYTAIVTGANNGTGVGLVGVFEVDRPDMPLANISTRGQVSTGNDRMIAGFIIQGSVPQKVVINVAGPFLNQFGLNGLADPQLTLVRQSDQVTLATNDDWQTQTNPADVAAITATGFQPNDPKEPAIIMTLPPGAYTAIVTGANNGTGVGLVGVFAAP